MAEFGRMKTDYPGHDGAYRRLKEKGALGWDEARVYAEREKQFLEVMRQGHVPRFGRLLELGCGAGNMTVWLSKLGYEAVGIDISPTAIEWAMERAKDGGLKIAFQCADVLKLDFLESDSFDLVLDGHCFHCIIGADRALFLKEAFRVLKPGGYFLVDTMCDPVSGNAMEGYDPLTKCTCFQGVATRYFGLHEEIGDEVEAAGFQIVSLDFAETTETHRNMILQAVKGETGGDVV